MRMKKIFLVLAAALCVATVSAQSNLESQVKQAAQTLAAQKWSVGLRVGTSAQVEAECFYSSNAYFEGLLGIDLINLAHPGVDFTVLHNWNCCTWDWTPSAGKWFLDAGVGVNVGGHGNGMWCGIAGQAKFGIKFNKVPIRLAVDVTPVVGPYIDYHRSTATDEAGNTVKVNGANTIHFRGLDTGGLFSAAISATYCF